MPTYEYRCRACGHRFEAVQSMKEEALTDCPKCAKPELARLISPGGGLLFKGSGFYTTDYRKESYKKAAKKESGDSTKSESKPETKPTSPSKPESKKD